MNLLTRYAILAGSSAQAGFQQKSLCNIYDFLKSTAGGTGVSTECGSFQIDGT
ncbi:hypothetical protein [Treponema brennaborense]|uniref:hypothetical protein n=1 Tax=Treponema brennaborense TaxID=81028 RepID=UPI0003128553|nr:hypothetical protein [Treponema brennaborense]